MQPHAPLTTPLYAISTLIFLRHTPFYAHLATPHDATLRHLTHTSLRHTMPLAGMAYYFLPFLFYVRFAMSIQPPSPPRVFLPFNAIPCHSISFLVIPYHSTPFHFIPHHSMPFHINPRHSTCLFADVVDGRLQTCLKRIDEMSKRSTWTIPSFTTRPPGFRPLLKDIDSENRPPIKRPK